MLLLQTQSRAGTPTSRLRPAMSIIEVMVFVVCLSVAVIGASGYRYFSTLHIRKSDIEITAGQTALLLCESWRGVGGIQTYDPLNDTGLGINITNASELLAPEPPLNFTSLGNYQVVADNHTYYVTLSYFDIDSYLSVLNVKTQWPRSERAVNENTGVNKSLSLSALVTR